MNVNFGLFPPLDDARGGRRGPQRPLQRLHRPRQGRLRRLARAGSGAGLSLRDAAWRFLRHARMNYVLALFLPPLSILLAGRPIVAIVTFLIWIPAILLVGGLTHPMFILLAWILIYQSRRGAPGAAAAGG